MPQREDLSELDAILARVEKVDFQVSEDTVAIPLAAKFVPTVLGLLEDAVDLLGYVQDRYEAEDVAGAGSEDESLVDIGALISSELAARSISDLAFVARKDLETCLQELGVAKNQNNFWQMASRCDTGLRRVRKALISVESSIYEYLGSKAPIRVWYDLELSLEIRKLYGSLRREILSDSPPPHRLEEGFREIVARFRELRSLDVYPLLRIDDRVQMRRLSQRILAWLHQEGEKDLEEGGRLWQDLTGFAELLAQINHRQELREHDRQLIDLGQRVLRNRRKGTGSLPEELLSDFENLLGLDDELDELILDPEENLQESWRAPLERLQTSLAPNQDRGGPF